MATVGILGDGAIGRLIAKRLADQDIDVYLKGRAPHPKAQDADLWLVCTKSHQAELALAALAPRPELPLVLLCNGLGPHERLAQRLSNPLFLGTTTYGAKRQGDQVLMTGRGHCGYGQVSGSLQPLPLVHWALHRALPPARYFPQVMEPLLQKLAINAVINPLTARDQVPNGALLASQYRQEITALIAEMTPVLQQEGLACTAQELLDNILAVAQATAANTSSMLADRQAGRKTEVDAINGYLCEKAQHHQLPAPLHRLLWQQIRELTT